MTGKIGRKRVLKFRDFPARYHDDVFFVERGYDEELILAFYDDKFQTHTERRGALPHGIIDR